MFCQKKEHGLRSENEGKYTRGDEGKGREKGGTCRRDRTINYLHYSYSDREIPRYTQHEERKNQARADKTTGVTTIGATSSKEKDVEGILVTDTQVWNVAVGTCIIGTSKQEEDREPPKGKEQNVEVGVG